MSVISPDSQKQYQNVISRAQLIELRSEKQEVPLNKLFKILEAHQFKRTSGSDGHHFFINQDTKETVRLITVHGANPPEENNRLTARACLKYRDHYRQQAKQEAQAALAQATLDAAAYKATIPTINTLENLPPHITGHTVEEENAETEAIEKTHILRHKKYPCIGIEVPKEMLPQSRQSLITGLEQRARKLAEELSLSAELYETTHSIDDGTLTITMLPYNIGLKLRPHLEDTLAAHPLTAFSTFTQQIENRDQNWKTLALNLKQRALEATKQTGHTSFRETQNQDGTKVWDILFSSSVLSHSSQFVPFKLSPQERPYHQDLLEFLDNVFAVECGLAPGQSYRRLIENRYGAKADERLANNTQIKITHPFYPGLEITIPRPDKVTRLQDLEEIIQNQGLTLEEAEKLEDKTSDQRQELALGLKKLNNLIVKRNNALHITFNAIAEQLGLNANDLLESANPKLSRAPTKIQSQQSTLQLQGPDNASHKIRINVTTLPGQTVQRITRQGEVTNTETAINQYFFHEDDVNACAKKLELTALAL